MAGGFQNADYKGACEIGIWALEINVLLDPKACKGIRKMCYYLRSSKRCSKEGQVR